MVTQTPADNVDRKLGRLLLRLWGAIAFLGAAASIGFGAVVLVSAPAPGVLLLFLGGLFFWLGRRAWRDRATLGEVLNRDYEPAARSKPSSHHGS